jgi:hypothetical protein
MAFLSDTFTSTSIKVVGRLLTEILTTEIKGTRLNYS